MKTLILGTVISALLFAACNNSQNAQTTTADSSSTQAANAKQGASSNGIKAIIDLYLELKNALAKDDDKNAASAGEKMVTAFAAFDKAALPEDQKTSYSEIEEDAKEHAEHISKNTGNIVHQREHFATLSKDIYDLVKTFGGGQPLYLDHCPMYDDNKGADWISETKEISNPYLGTKMPDCGTVKEELKL